jgi:two-component system response regulator RegA
MNVLIIEDDIDFRNSLAKDFERKASEVHFVSTLEELQNFSPVHEITHAVVDLRLKLSSGLDFIPVVRERYPSSIIVMLTAYGSISTSVEAIKKGANEYLLKPCRFVDLYSTLIAGEKIAESTPSGMLDLYQKEKEYIDYVLKENAGNVSKSAEVLGIRRQSLQRKLKKYTEKKIE